MTESPQDKLRASLVRALQEVERLRKKIGLLEHAAHEPIAVVGIGLRLPGGVIDLSTLWTSLENEVDAIGPIPASRWDAAGVYDANPDRPGKTYVRDAAFLDAVDGFDPTFFSISPREAISIDPQHRLLLEGAWEALETAGIVPASLRETKVGVFIGIGPSDYGLSIRDQIGTDSYGIMTHASFGAGRIAFTLGVQGPAMCVDTACSSSLVALHLACNSLRADECTLALAGGVQVMAAPDAFIQLARTHALAPDGRSKTFSDHADGYGRGEGTVVLALERLSTAQSHGRSILAVIRGSAVNHDGPSSGITAPNGTSQQKVLRAALSDARLQPADVDVVECHGTGTSLGDPIEVQALGAVYGEGRPRERPLLLGAIKTNIGHLESAAGLAGVAKIIAAMRHGALPATIHTRPRNRHIDWESLPVEVVDGLRPWTPEDGNPRRAGVSAFGLSGTNAHVILEQAPATPEPADPGPELDEPVCLLLSGQDEAALRDQAARLRDHLDLRSDLRLVDVGFSLATQRTTFRQRAIVVADDAAQARRELDALACGVPSPRYVRGVADVDGKLMFLFPGQGSQWPAMARALLEQSEVFREQIEACAAALAPHTDWSLLAVLYQESGAASLDRVDVVQPVLFAMMVSLAALWRSIGVEPDAVIGHSQGEIAAAQVAGILSLEDAAKVVALRSRVIRALSGAGAMAAVSLPADDLRSRIERYGSRLSLAVDNGPASTVASGEPAAIDELVAELTAAGVFARRVAVDYASHCGQVEAIEAELEAMLAEIRPREARIPMFSTVDAEPVVGSNLDGRYWYRNLRQTVRFADAVGGALTDGCRMFVEVSPHPVLTMGLSALLSSSELGGAVVPTLRRDEGSISRVWLALAELCARGFRFDWARHFTRRSPRGVDLPTYAFQRKSYWHEPQNKRPNSLRAPQAGGHPFIGHGFGMSRPEDVRYWEREISLEFLPWLADHRVETACLFPGAGFVEIMLAAIRDSSGAFPITLEQVRFDHAMALAPGAPTEIQVASTPTSPTSWNLVISQASPDGWRELSNAQAKLGGGTAGRTSNGARLTDARRRNDLVTDAVSTYGQIAAMGLSYGPAFRAIEQLFCSPDRRSVLGCISLPPAAGPAAEFGLHPVLLDGCLQLAAVLGIGATGPSVPVRIDGMVALREFDSGPIWCEARTRDDGSGPISFTIWSPDGDVLAEIDGLHVESLHRAEDPFAKVLLEIAWRDVTELPQLPSTVGRWLVLADQSGAAGLVVAALRAAGGRVDVAERIDPTSRAAVARALRSSAGDEPLRGVIDLWALDIPPAGGASTFPQDTEVGWGGAVNLLVALRDQQLRDHPRTVFVTHCSQASKPGEFVRPEQALLWGAAGTMHSEHREFRPMRIDLGDPRSAEEIRALVRWAISDSEEDQIVIRDVRCQVARLARARMPAPVRHRMQASKGRPYRLEVSGPGSLDSLQFTQFERRDLKAGEVEIAIEAAGLNFRDVLLASGLIPPTVGDRVQLGFECVGRITRIGSGVPELVEGQRVIAVALDCFATHCIANADLVLALPEQLSAAAAATLPVAHITAYHALEHVARLRAGERILIHSAAGGVGIAAIQWAKHVGAQIYATTSSEAKRAWLNEQGVQYVSDSRSTRFVDDIRRWTEDQGVDVVLNALTGELMHASLGLLRPGGRFIELGLRDAFANTRLGLAPFVRNLSYHLVNLADMVLRTPKRARERFVEVLEHVKQGVLTPLPILSHGLAEAPQALWEMARGRHVGKFVLTMSASDPPLVAVPVEPTQVWASPGKTCLITGGLGGLGLSLAKWMAECGMGHLVLVGRTKPTRIDQHEAIAAIEGAGARVTVATADVASREQLAEVIAAIPTDRPLAGVVHTAGVLDDAMMVDLTPEHFSRVMAPKVIGGWNLHELTRPFALDFFVMYSSAAGVLGTPAQANYAAANAFVDALAHYRRNQGLVALSIAWGVFAEVGLAAAQDVRGMRLAGRGVTALTPEQGVQLFASLVGGEASHAVPCPFDVRKWIEFYPQAASWPFLAELLVEAPSVTSELGDKWVAIVRASPNEARQRIVDHVLEELGNVVRMDARQLDPNSPFTSLGIDSLMGVELRNRLESSTGQSLPSTAIWTYPTPKALAAFLLDKFLGESKDAGNPVDGADAVDSQAELRKHLEDISDDELLALGEEFLA